MNGLRLERRPLEQMLMNSGNKIIKIIVLLVFKIIVKMSNKQHGPEVNECKLMSWCVGVGCHSPGQIFSHFLSRNRKESL